MKKNKSKVMKELAFMILGFSNLFVAVFAEMGIVMSTHHYYHDHWTAFHFVSLGGIAFVTASTTALCFQKAMDCRR